MAEKTDPAPTGYTAIAVDPYASQVARDHSHPYQQGGRTAEEAFDLLVATDKSGPSTTERVVAEKPTAPASGKQTPPS